ncbi:mitochondrial carrier domain-containing protein [Desarmillaria tabescens]|uniref:Mitochondrial carrier domain-containing protein n=1 Tax=Armillaria tabescens TaxID=1929756 RepID=A0AA39N7X7_ARMTA|nr:mitochondrial carrier domain-containing protein [Desarmillaria tabescens]KAK0460686.1 mitochondrial carrier domain-containing protein [Desarmillaria tabescens]
MAAVFVVPLPLPALAISLAVTVPLTGILVRFRANYTPKSRIALDEENAAPTCFTYTYLGTARRIYRIEGWRGFFKGYVPLLFSFLCVRFGMALFTSYEPNVRRGVPQILPLGIVKTVVVTLLSIILGVPYRVIVYRSMVTPYNLSFLDPIGSWNALLLPTLFPSGLLSVTAIITVASAVFGPIKALMLTWSNNLAYPISNLPLALYYILEIVFTIMITPLNMIATRLAVQGSDATREVEENSAVGETVVRLRDEQVEDPYTGVIDCVTRIWDEEGWPVLYRGWWFALLTSSAAYFL